jgi:RiboL-PSP-HEPN
MLAAARREIPRTDKFSAFALPLSGALRGTEDRISVDAWLGPLIVERHSIVSFQRSDKIADAIKLICAIEGGLWPAVSRAMGVVDTKRIKEQLDLIVDRRNAIAHEDDAGASGERAPIDSALVSSALDFIESVVIAIDQAVNQHG